MKASKPLTIIAGLSLGSLISCFSGSTADDECLVDSDCDALICHQFICVSDDGPDLLLESPDKSGEGSSTTTFSFGSSSIEVQVSGTGLTFTDQDSRNDGEGRIEVTLDPGSDDESTVISDGEGALINIDEGTLTVPIDISALASGPHHLRVRAVYGDGSPYENRSATETTMFFIEAELEATPHVGIISPAPGDVHLAGEPLLVKVATHGDFDFVDTGESCKGGAGCDPFDPMCVDDDCGGISQDGHAHVYLIDDYPACLTDEPTGCNGQYVITLRPGEAIASSEGYLEAEIPATVFSAAGTFDLSISLQYSDHDPYPTAAAPLFDQIPIEVITR